MTFALAKYRKFEKLCQGGYGFVSGNGSFWIKKDTYIIMTTFAWLVILYFFDHITQFFIDMKCVINSSNSQVQGIEKAESLLTLPI